MRAGTITALIGPNGAGKTTAFQCITGVIPPDGGRVDVRRPRHHGLAARPHHARRPHAHVPDRARHPAPVRAREPAALRAATSPASASSPRFTGGGRARRGGCRAHRALEIATRLNLPRVANKPAAALSGGQKKLLEIGRALMAEPRMILLDEPIAGVNPTLAEEIADHLRALRDEGITFLVIEHHMDLIARLCDPVIVMAEGRTLTEGSFAEVAADPEVQEAYMGTRRWA